MNTTRTCPQCGAKLDAEAPEGLCPACLMKAGLPTSAAGPRTAPAADPLAPAEIAKHFPQLEILELLGQGGMGVVYKARQPQLDRLVALKILTAEAGRDPAFAERFTREARALAKLSHPNIVAVYDFGQVDESCYFIMEFVDGVNLRQLERAGKLTPAQSLAIVPKICDALQYAHDEGIVHRDIKPENILVDKKGRVKIADFGLAKLLGKAATDYTLTGTHQAMGTPHYMAPEQMEKPLSVDHRADIYSLGVVFYEMLTGELPLGRFAPPSQKVRVDVRLDEVVLKSLENEPDRRYQHVSEVKTAVEGVTGTPQLSVAPAPDAIRRQVKGPALGLLATTIFNWIIVLWFLFGAPLILHRSAGPSAQREIAMLASSGAGILVVFLTTLITVGALKMRRLESYGWALTASIVAIFGGAIGLPFGIWALVVLIRPEVKAAFQSARAQGTPPTAPGRSETNWAKIVWIGVSCLLVIPLVIGLVLTLSHERTKTASPRSGPAMTLKSFTTTDPTIAKDLVLEDGGWLANCAEARTIPLFEVASPGVEDCKIIYRAQLKTEGLKGRAYLEMWCRLPGHGEAFSRGLDHVATGSTDWASYETPFFLKKGEKPDLLRLNLVVEGTGRVGIRNVEVRKITQPEESR